MSGKKEKIPYVKIKLFKLQRSFSHQLTETVLNLHKPTIPYENLSETSRILQDICRQCDTCQCFCVPPVIFKVSLPTEKDPLLGDELSIGSLFLDKVPALRVAGTTTPFLASTYLDKHFVTNHHPVEGLRQTLATSTF